LKFEPQVFAVVPPVVAPADDDALASYAAMDELLSTLSSSTELGSPILPCQQPCIEVTVTDEEHLPLSAVPYRLLLEEAVLAEGTLDDTGFVSIPEQELPPGDWNIEISLQRNESTWVVERADIHLIQALPVADEEEGEAPIETRRWLPFMDAPYDWD